MKLYEQDSRPHASFTCPPCRAVNIVEYADLPESGMIELECALCGKPHGVDSGYMHAQMERDLAKS